MAVIKYDVRNAKSQHGNEEKSSRSGSDASKPSSLAYPPPQEGNTNKEKDAENQTDAEISDAVQNSTELVDTKKDGETNTEMFEMENETVKKEELTGWRRYLGIGLMLAATVILSMETILAKLLDDYQLYSVVLWRCMGGLFIPALTTNIILQFFSNSKPLNQLMPRGNMKRHGTLLIRGIFGFGAITFRYKSMQYISVSDSTVVAFSTPVLVTFLAACLLGEKFGIMHVVASAITLFGVVIISKPPFLTGAEDIDINLLKGVGLALAAMLCATGMFLLLRVLNDTHFMAVVLMVGFYGITGSLILCIIDGNIEFPETGMDWMLACFLTCSTFTGQVLFTLAFHYEETGPLSLIKCTDVMFAFIWQSIFLGAVPDVYSAIGSVFVVSGVLLLGVRKYVDALPEDHRCRRICFFILK